MNFKHPTTLVVILSFFFFTSCSDKSSNDTSSDPELEERYFFEGKLDNVPFVIEKKVSKDSFDEDFFLVDYGGTLINCSNEPANDVHTDCYTYYAFGIFVNRFVYPEEVDKHDTAKMYFGPIDVENRIFDEELIEINNFFQNTEIGFRRDFGDIENQGGFAFDFFPLDTNGNSQFYYSTRFNDNSGYTAKITSFKAIDDYFYNIEGTVESCKLYDSRDVKDENQSYKMLTDFKFSVKIKGDFNYNNYKDD